MRNCHGGEAPETARVERQVIFAPPHGIVVPVASGIGDTVVLEDVPAKGLAVGVPARVVNNLDTKNGHTLLARGTARFDNGRTFARVPALGQTP